jgi:uncharacterized protein (TIGR01244 family)
MKKTTIQLFLCFLLMPVLPMALHAGEKVAVDVSKGDIPGIYNYSYNTDPTGFGGATDPSAMTALSGEGYKSVINLRLEGEKGNDLPASSMAAGQAGLNYIHLPFNSRDPDPAFFDQFVAAVNDEANQPVYIHCGSATRVAAVWMSKRVVEDGWTMEQAEAEARAIAGKPDAAVAFAGQYIETIK